MKVSTRNSYTGAVLNIKHGVVNDEVEILLDSSNTRLTAVIPSAARKSMGLEPGSLAVALVKEETVVLIWDMEGVRFPSFNNLSGTVLSVNEHGVFTEVNLRLFGGESLTATVNTDIEVKSGDSVHALIKANTIIIGVRE